MGEGAKWINELKIIDFLNTSTKRGMRRVTYYTRGQNRAMQIVNNLFCVWDAWVNEVFVVVECWSLI